LSTIQTNPSREGPVSALPPRQRKTRLLALLVGLVFSAALFFTLDWFHTAAVRRTAGNWSSCRAHDPVRHHAFKPNCTSMERWGGDSFELMTNSLGFRDDRVREIPLAEAQPRILMLGDSFTEGKLAWRDSYVGKIAARFPQYDFLNGGVGGYSPSNYLNTARMVLAKGVDFDEAIIFIDISDVHDEAAFYRDVDASGAVTGPERERWNMSTYTSWRLRIANRLLLTNYIFEFFERFLVAHGYYCLSRTGFGNVFDMEKSAWSYRKVNETAPYSIGYAPLGVEGGIAKEKAKMDLLWQELAKRNIPISVVVYPWPAQVAYDTADSRQARIWRDWCVGKCKRFISLFPDFLAVKDQCPRIRPGCWYEKLFVFEDTHFNAGGNALVADAVIKSLAADPPAKRPETSLAPETGQGRGTR